MALKRSLSNYLPSYLLSCWRHCDEGWCCCFQWGPFGRCLDDLRDRKGRRPEGRTHHRGQVAFHRLRIGSIPSERSCFLLASQSRFYRMIGRICRILCRIIWKYHRGWFPRLRLTNSFLLTWHNPFYNRSSHLGRSRYNFHLETFDTRSTWGRRHATRGWGPPLGCTGRGSGLRIPRTTSIFVLKRPPLVPCHDFDESEPHLFWSWCRPSWWRPHRLYLWGCGVAAGKNPLGSSPNVTRALSEWGCCGQGKCGLSGCRRYDELTTETPAAPMHHLSAHFSCWQVCSSWPASQRVADRRVTRESSSVAGLAEDQSGGGANLDDHDVENIDDDDVSIWLTTTSYVSVTDFWSSRTCAVLINDHNMSHDSIASIWQQPLGRDLL